MDEEEQEERPRPRIVDKRRTGRSSPPPPQDPPPPPSETPAPEEVRVDAPGPGPAAAEPGSYGEEAAAEPGGERAWTPEEEAAAQQMARDLAERPSMDWVLNVAVTLANVAGAKIQLGAADDARLAIDTLDAIVDRVAAQLEGAEAPLRQTLAQLQMAYAQAVKPPGGA